MESEQVVKDALRGLEFGSVQKYKNMAVVPIILQPNSQSSLNYLTLEDALKENVLEIIETGSVNQLNVKNRSDQEVLVVKGEYVIGGKQNRMITVNAMLDKNAKEITLPVHCVQQGRWSAPGTFDPQIRRVSTGPATLRSCTTKAFSSSRGQQHTWANVGSLLRDVDVDSASGDCNAAFEGKQEDIADIVKKFTYFKDKQVGCVVAVNNNGNTEYFVDMFDQAKTMEKHYERLVTSYAIDSLRTKTDSVEFGKKAAEDVVRLLLESETKTSPSLSLGKDVELSLDKNKHIYGAALVHNDVMVYCGANISDRPKQNSNTGDLGNRDLNQTMIFDPPRRDRNYTTGSPFIRRSDLYKTRK